MRGKRGVRCFSIVSDRITPADAGKTRRNSQRKGLLEDHPRRCGENTVKAQALLQKAGSPPQVRGKL